MRNKLKLVCTVTCLSVLFCSIPTYAAETKTKTEQTTKETKVSSSSDLEAYEKELKEFEAELDAREKELDKLESDLNKRDTEITKREKELGGSVSQTNVTSSSKLLLEGANLTRIGVVSDSQVQAVVKGFNTLPSQVQNTLVTAGYRVEVTDEDIEKLITGTGTNSWYGASASSPLWVIIVGINQTEENMTRTMIHESAHCYDACLGNWSNQAVWTQCYAAEGKTLWDTALVNNQKEWFAECFTFYLINPTYLKQVAPLSYDAIDKYIFSIM